MALFGLGKKKEKKVIPTCSCCSCSSVNKTHESDLSDVVGTSANAVNSIKVLGAGCRSCHEQYENVKEAVRKSGLQVDVEYITDMEKVMSYGVMSMPVIVVNEKVVSAGKVLKTADVEKLLNKI